jgi:hypothetical protein
MPGGWGTLERSESKHQIARDKAIIEMFGGTPPNWPRASPPLPYRLPAPEPAPVSGKPGLSVLWEVILADIAEAEFIEAAVG